MKERLSQLGSLFLLWNTISKTNLLERVWLMLHLSAHCWRKLELKHGRIPEEGADAESTDGCFLMFTMAWIAFFVIKPRTTIPGTALPTMGLSSHINYQFRKFLLDLLTAWFLSKHLLIWGSFPLTASVKLTWNWQHKMVLYLSP